MKKNVLASLFVAFALLFSVPSNAQVQWGVKAGIDLNTLSLSAATENCFDKNNRVGFFVGGLVDFKIPLLGFGCDISVLYENKKTSFDYTPISISSTDEVITGDPIPVSKTLNMISIPVNLKHTFSLGSVVSLYLATGPQASINLSRNITLTDADGNDIIDEKTGEAMTKSMRRVEVYWNFGAGVTLFKHYRLGYAYNLPLNTSINWSGVFQEAGSSSLKVKNRTHQISFSYMF